MLTAMLSVTLAFAGDQTRDAETSELIELSRQAIKGCRKAGSPGEMAYGTVSLRQQAQMLSAVLVDLTTNQFPVLGQTLGESSHLSIVERTAGLALIDDLVVELNQANRLLNYSIHTSEQIGSLLSQPEPHALRHQSRHEAVRMCAGDRVQLYTAMVSVGKQLETQEPAIANITLLMLRAITPQPET